MAMGQRRTRQGFKVLGLRRSTLLDAVAALALLVVLATQATSFLGSGTLPAPVRAAVAVRRARQEAAEEAGAEATSFLGSGTPPAPVRAAVAVRRARQEAAEEAGAEVAEEWQVGTRVLQMPEVNYFTNQAIMECLEEGCSIEALEELIGKLQRDEHRIEEALKELRAAQEEQHSADIAETLGWFRNFLDNSRQLREALQSVEGLKHATTHFAKQFVDQGRRGSHERGEGSAHGSFGGTGGPMHLGRSPAKSHR